MNNKPQGKTTMSEISRIRLGFVPLTDCAPLVMAHELGFFRKKGIEVTLHRELGWATIRDKLIYGEIEAAHALAAMPFAATLGLGSARCECLAGLVLNLHGNAITLSNKLREDGVRDGASLKHLIQQSRNKKAFVFGAVAPFSSHRFLLRNWLASSGIQPERDVRIVIVPPPQMVANLKAGHLDGFCAGEPWNSVAVHSRVGWCVAASAELAPGHPEKVLMVRRDFAESRASEHIALLAALLEACSYCDRPENQERVIDTLARKEYIGANTNALRPGLRGEFNFGHGHIRLVREFTVFHRDDANEPSAEKAAWVLQQLRALPTGLESSTFNAALGRRVFRPDIYEEAKLLRADSVKSGDNQREALLLAH